MSKDDFLILHCNGCGAVLQNDDPNKVGYIPKKLEKNSDFLCQRCFRLNHYGELYNDKPVFNDYLKIIKNAKAENALIILVVDLFAFESSLVPNFLKELMDTEFIVIANKKDIMPQSVSDYKYELFVRSRFSELNLKPKDVIITSSVKNYNIEFIIEKYRLEKSNVYLFGSTSVGKSTFINTFLKNYTNNTNEMITTSPYPNTTLDVIKIPLGRKTYIYDTPGILVQNSVFAHIDQKLFKYILPRKEIKPKTFQMNSNQSLIVNNLARIDFVNGEKTSFTFFLSNDLEISRTKLENADKVFQHMIENKQFKLLDRNINTINDLQDHTFEIGNNDIDITISGLLWIKIKGKGGTIKVYAPKGVLVASRGCKI